MATGPVKPVGTTHWLKGSESEAGMPPASIWHDKVEVSLMLLRASKLNVNEVPAWMEPVVVTVKGGRPTMPVSHPEMKLPAIARTSWGSRGISNACGMAVPPFNTLRMV